MGHWGSDGGIGVGDITMSLLLSDDFVIFIFLVFRFDCEGPQTKGETKKKIEDDPNFTFLFVYTSPYARTVETITKIHIVLRGTHMYSPLAEW